MVSLIYTTHVVKVNLDCTRFCDFLKVIFCISVIVHLPLKGPKIVQCCQNRFTTYLSFQAINFRLPSWCVITSPVLGFPLWWHLEYHVCLPTGFNRHRSHYLQVHWIGQGVKNNCPYKYDGLSETVVDKYCTQSDVLYCMEDFLIQPSCGWMYLRQRTLKFAYRLAN